MASLTKNIPKRLKHFCHKTSNLFFWGGGLQISCSSQHTISIKFSQLVMHTLIKELHILAFQHQVHFIISSSLTSPPKNVYGKCTPFWMLVSFNNKANILHLLSIKEFLCYSANHTYIFVGFEWVLHDEIVAFIPLGAVQND